MMQRNACRVFLPNNKTFETIIQSMPENIRTFVSSVQICSSIDLRIVSKLHPTVLYHEDNIIVFIPFSHEFPSKPNAQLHLNELN